MYQSLWTIYYSFVGIVDARMRKVLKEQKKSWRFIANLLLICSLKKSQQPSGKRKGFNIWKAWSMTHPLLLAKLKVFEIVSSKLNVFLRGLQTNKPMVPLLVTSVENWFVISLDKLFEKMFKQAFQWIFCVHKETFSKIADLLLSLRFLGGLYNFCNFIIIFSLRSDIWQIWKWSNTTKKGEAEIVSPRKLKTM